MAEEKQKQEKKPKADSEHPAAKKARKAKEAAAAAAAQAESAGGEEAPQEAAPTPRLIATYRDQVIPALLEKFKYKNKMAVPRIEKIVISMGLGKAVTSGEKGKLEQAEKELTVIAGQKPIRCKAVKSVANFKVREGQETGLKVTIRGNRMYEFLDRLIAIVIPRVKDFRGLNPNGFDKSGNYNFGFTEQTVFPEVDSASVTFQQGMNITMVTTARNPAEGRELLRAFGFPFKTDTKEK
jgi:large subunit ribosomal protein L5